MLTPRSKLAVSILIALMTLGLAGHTPGQAAPATSTPSPSVLPLPCLTLKQGEFYFRVAGKPRFIFSRNIAGYQQSDFKTQLDWSASGGSKLVRIHLVQSMGFGMTNTGALDETWAKQWDQILDKARPDGLSVLPVFDSWFAWNSANGYLWPSNPLNQSNGGPASTPEELLRPNSTTQKLWLKWMKTLVKRWHTRPNIAGWEIFSELNLVSGATESLGVDFVERAASTIRADDPKNRPATTIRADDCGYRPVTASLADFDEWSSLYSSPAIDFINFHPYPASGELDTYIISSVRQKLAKYHKPVFIGESGLSAQLPDSNPPTLTTAASASLGIKHAIWAGIVSGAMNGRALWWEDGNAIFFPSLGYPFLQKYADAEHVAANFVRDVNFAGFKPLTVTSSAQITGGAVGNSRFVIGWLRDAGSEPPDWNLQPVLSNQTVSITVPGSAPRWRVDFYSPETGAAIGSILTARVGQRIAVALPDFKDDLAFKAFVTK